MFMRRQEYSVSRKFNSLVMCPETDKILLSTLCVLSFGESNLNRLSRSTDEED